jgi:hypothetical protein
VYAGALLLQAFFQGDNSSEALAGAMFLAAGILAMIPDPRQRR